MNRNKSATVRHIVAKGNYPIREANQPLFFDKVGTRGRRGIRTWNGSPGQLFVAKRENGQIPVTIGIDDIDDIVSEEILIGVFLDTNGDGVTDTIRLAGGDNLRKCDIQEAGITKPCCGQSPMEVISIDCTECDKTYVAQVKVDNNASRTWGNLMNSWEQYLGTYTTNCCSCDDCSPEQNCREVICGLVDALNGEQEIMIGDDPYPDYKPANLPRPFRAVVGQKRYIPYCISPKVEDCKCDTCKSIDAITTITVAGKTVPLMGNLNPADNTQTLIGQLEGIAAQIECAFEERLGVHSGFAVVQRGESDCCPVKLHVFTCDDTFAIDGLEPCEDVTLPPEFSITPSTCSDCTKTDEPCYIPECWFAVIGIPERTDCSCILEEDKQWHGMQLEVDIIRNPSGCVPKVRKQTVFEGMSPRNLGIQVQNEEYIHGLGPQGLGHQHGGSNYTGIKNFGFPTKDSRVRQAVTADCKKMYCGYWLYYEHKYRGLENTDRYASFETTFWIDNLANETIETFEPLFNKLITANNGACKLIGEKHCFDAETPPEPSGTPAPTSTPEPTPTP